MISTGSRRRVVPNPQGRATSLHFAAATRHIVLMLRRSILVLLVALFAVGEMSASIAFAQDATQQQPQKKRRTLFDMLFGGGDQQDVPPPAAVVTSKALSKSLITS